MSLRSLLRRALSGSVLAVGLMSLAPSAHAVAPALKAYNVNIADSSVSGLSSGGFMAVQLGVAYSSVFKGVGVFAGGTFDCAGTANYTSCMYNQALSPSGAVSTMKSWSGTSIDATSNIARQKVYIFVGSSDTTVGPNITDAVNAMYTTSGAFVSAANVKYDKLSGAAHTFPTDFAGTGDNACSSASSPYISNCSYDGAGNVLQWIYGTLNARNNGTLGGSLISFDQSAFITGNGMDTTGYLYVPAACASGAQCKLHVALHGCMQSYSQISDKFTVNTGYNKWADTNNIIVLYPQTVVDNTSHTTAASGSLANPNACWDWIGWYGTNFAQKAGVQQKAIMAMVNKITSGYTGGTGGGTTIPAAPTSLTGSAASSSAISLSWTGSSGATSYNVYRGTTKVGSTGATSYTDSGLTASTTYSYAVTAVNSLGESAKSTSISVQTAATVPYSQAVSDTVTNHYVAGRINVTQYNQLGVEYGYNTVITLYLCGTTWTNSSTCGPMF